MSKDAPAPLDHLSSRLRKELFAFTGAFLYNEISLGRVPLEPIAAFIPVAVEEARGAMAEGHIDGFTAWWKQSHEASLAVHRALYNKSGAYTLATPSGDREMREGFEDVGLTEADIAPSPERWHPTVRENAARYVAAYFIDPENPLPARHRRFKTGADLSILGGLPKRLPAHELAARIATRLTAEGQPNRLDYRLRTRRGKGPHYPTALVEAVAEEMSVSVATARRRMVEGEFELPLDLTFVLRSPRNPKG
ncbi:hypothetical protein [Rubricoccus marinus]|uniref:Uncharacterized protein n=1 Tax=Rubricoccus marinus TaxID=716817 RepID=A0A259U2K7_9BACT|nr:hypothetical protein [Rubricoccus marinus]OZC04034.1 hypothetical protein BSZ36_14200 [Rubricoccus marinus]